MKKNSLKKTQIRFRHVEDEVNASISLAGFLIENNAIKIDREYNIERTKEALKRIKKLNIKDIRKKFLLRKDNLEKSLKTSKSYKGLLSERFQEIPCIGSISRIKRDETDYLAHGPRLKGRVNDCSQSCEEIISKTKFLAASLRKVVIPRAKTRIIDGNKILGDVLRENAPHNFPMSGVIELLSALKSNGLLEDHLGTLNNEKQLQYSMFDACAGWGQRQLGALCCNEVSSYVGIDPNSSMQDVYKLGKQILLDEFGVNKPSVVHLSTVEEYLLKLTKEEEESCDIGFTSPPYYNAEIYSSDEGQSSKRYNSYQKWKNGFLYPFVQLNDKVLKPRGILAVNIANHKTYPLCKDLLEYCARLNLWLKGYLVLEQPGRCSGTDKSAVKNEPVFIFQKIKSPLKRNPIKREDEEEVKELEQEHKELEEECNRDVQKHFKVS